MSAEEQKKLANYWMKFCQATLQWVYNSVGASQPSTRYLLSGRIYCETENPCEGSQLSGRAQWSIHEEFTCARNEVWPCAKGLLQSRKWTHLQGSSRYGKSQESADKQLQLMNTEVQSISFPKAYQRQGNQQPTSNTSSSWRQACRNCGWGPQLKAVPSEDCHYCQKVGHLTKVCLSKLKKKMCMKFMKRLVLAQVNRYLTIASHPVITFLGGPN